MEVKFRRLGETPVYIVLASDAPPREFCSPRAAEFTGRYVDILLQPWLESRGLWQGRRACIAHNSVRNIKLALDDARSQMAEAVAEMDRLRNELLSE